MSIRRLSPDARAPSALSPEPVILGLLAGRPAHGYDLHQSLVRNLGHLWRVSQSQVYNILTRLERQGLIRGTVSQQTRRPARTVFRLTAHGQRRFERWMASAGGASARSIRIDFLSRLYFARQRGPTAVETTIDRQVQATAHGLAQIEERLHALPADQTFNRLGLALRVRQLTTILAWLEECRRELAAAG